MPVMHIAGKRLILVLFSLLTLLAPVLVAAQESQPTEGDEQSSASAASEQSQAADGTPSFAVNVNLVSLFLTVKDRHGAPVRNLSREDFEVYEDGKPQAIKYFQADAPQPLTLGLLVDTSGSTQRMLPFIRHIGMQFFTKVLREKDLAFLMSFDVGVNLLHDLTSPGSDLLEAMFDTSANGGDSLIPDVQGFPDPRKGSRGTLLYDAVYLAATDELKHEVGRKTIVVITDGTDQGSVTSIPATIEAAQKVDASVFVLIAADPEYGERKEDIGRIAKETGGNVIEVGQKPGGLEKAIELVSEELRSQYYIGYIPTRRPDGSFRKIRVQLKHGDYHAQVRKGYYAPKQEPGSTIATPNVAAGGSEATPGGHGNSIR
jgi:VWFA-related protein